jgi:putative 2OG-Fe(II) oxygenase
MLPFDCSLPAAQLSVLEGLWRDGYVRIRGLIDSQDTSLLADESARMMREQPRVPFSERTKYGQQYRVPVYFDSDWSVLSNVIGLSQRADEAFERLFTRPELVSLLRAILGPGYKLWELSIRRSEKTDSGLRMHQDAVGEFGMAVLLQDIPEKGSGGTAFLPGSHRFPLSSRQAGMPYIHPKYLRRWAKEMTGSAGDVFLFCKSLWHGRLPTADGVPHDLILLSFFASGYEFTPFEMAPEELPALPELRRLLDMRQGTRALPAGRFRVEAPEPGASRLIDALYDLPAAHPAQLLRVLPALFAVAAPIKRALRI